MSSTYPTTPQSPTISNSPSSSSPRHLTSSETITTTHTTSNQQPLTQKPPRIPPLETPCPHHPHHPTMSPRTSIALQQGVGNGNIDEVKRVTETIDGRHGHRNGKHHHNYFQHHPHLRSGLRHIFGNTHRGNGSEQNVGRSLLREEFGEEIYQVMCNGNGGRAMSLQQMGSLHDKDSELDELCRCVDIDINTVTDDERSTIASVAGGDIGRQKVFLKGTRRWEWKGVSDRKRKCKRRAVLIGIDYWNCPHGDELGGCVNDCEKVLKMLVEVFGFEECQIVVLNDYLGYCGQDKFPNVHRHEHPTRVNIMYWIDWLTHGARPGDTMFLWFGGHGDQVVCRTGYEIDGKDEVLLPVDHRQRRIQVITDDEIYDEVVKKVPKDCFLFAMFDCCHSGTNMDLPYVACSQYDRDSLWQLVGEEYYNYLRARKHKVDFHPALDESCGIVVALAGTSDAGKSLEVLEHRASLISVTSPFSKHGIGRTGSKGLTTEYFVKTIREHANKLETLTYAGLMKGVNTKLRQFLETNKLFSDQAPALSASLYFNLDSPFRL